MITVFEAPRHRSLTIASVTGEDDLALRLRELGFREGVQIRVLGQAPFSGPLLIEVQNSVLALRTVEAQCLRLHQI